MGAVQRCKEVNVGHQWACGLLLAVCGLGCGWTDSVPPDPVHQVLLIPQGVGFESWREFTFSILDAAEAPKGPVVSAAFEIRTAGSGRRVAELEHLHEFSRRIEDRRPVREQGWAQRFQDTQWRRIPASATGDFDVVFLLNGVRASNVVRVRVGQKAPAPGPVQLSWLEPVRAGDEPRVLAWGVGPPAGRKPLYPKAVMQQPLWVNGVERKRQMFVTMGIWAPVPPGQFWWSILDPQAYEPAFRWSEAGNVVLDWPEIGHAELERMKGDGEPARGGVRRRCPSCWTEKWKSKSIIRRPMPVSC